MTGSRLALHFPLRPVYLRTDLLEALRDYLGVDEGYADPVVVKEHGTLAPKHSQLLGADASYGRACLKLWVGIRCGSLGWRGVVTLCFWERQGVFSGECTRGWGPLSQLCTWGLLGKGVWNQPRGRRVARV